LRIYREVKALRPDEFRSPAVTLGVFDGVHLGHRAIFDALARAAERTGGEKVVVTFDRHPRAVVAREAPPTLTSLEHRLALFERAGIDAAVILRFDEALASVSAEDFLRDILLGGIGARAIVLGSDAHFGRGRAGNIAFLEEQRPRYGYDLIPVQLLPGASGDTASSTATRRAVQEGRLEDAARLLGRSFAILGRVERGDERGRKLGFPTANLALHHEVTPPRGVYVGRVEVDGVRYRALVNIGVRPTFAGASEEKVEAHLLGFEGNLYGRVLEVELLRRLRDERKFASVDELIAQIRADREAALADAVA
jgi:riboflavin kinase/FMN adenylyltransferase